MTSRPVCTPNCNIVSYVTSDAMSVIQHVQEHRHYKLQPTTEDITKKGTLLRSFLFQKNIRGVQTKWTLCHSHLKISLVHHLRINSCYSEYMPVPVAARSNA
jgi:hypothetical protein